MKIKIISCTNHKSWYKNRIGQILEVNKWIQHNGKYEYPVYEYHGKDDNGYHINGLFDLKDIIEITD